MQAPEFTTVYNILNEGYLNRSWFIILWLVLLVIIALWNVARIRKGKNIPGGTKRFYVGLIGVTPFFLVGIYASYYGIRAQYNGIQSARNNDFEVTEGRISGLKTAAKYESFTVNEVIFEYHEANFECGYKQSKGIELSENMLVRISYRNGCILKMETAGR